MKLSLPIHSHIIKSIKYFSVHQNNLHINDDITLVGSCSFIKRKCNLIMTKILRHLQWL